MAWRRTPALEVLGVVGPSRRFGGPGSSEGIALRYSDGPMPLAESRQRQWPGRSCACLRYLRLPSSGHSAWSVPGRHRACGGHSRWWPWSSARRRQRPSFPGTLAAGSTTSASERDRAQEGGGEREVGGPHTFWRRFTHSPVLWSSLRGGVSEPGGRRRWVVRKSHVWERASPGSLSGLSRRSRRNLGLHCC